ncbi:MAG: hypothetical protein N0E53_11450 [Candidatus Thiodiazotropha taylori]|nr:hypothetical protein [Candidatus Thiodiazotropha taylori]
MSMVEYCGVVICLGGGHPLPKIREHELNPLQRIVFLSPDSDLPGVLVQRPALSLLHRLGSGVAQTGSTPLPHTEVAFPMLTYLYLAIPASKEPLGYPMATIAGYEEKLRRYGPEFQSGDLFLIWD